jgi:hypothetical protein
MMIVRRALAAVLLAGMALTTVACSKIQTANAVYDTIAQPASNPVPADAVILIGNSFDVLKAGAVAFARYCVANKMTPALCSVDNRRVVSQAVKAGTAARNTAEYAVNTGQPVSTGVYNAIANAVASLQSSPATSFVKGGAS